MLGASADRPAFPRGLDVHDRSGTGKHRMNPIVLKPRRFADDRGWFSETYNAARLAEIGITDHFVQDNHSLSVARHTIRGMHFQAPPHAQAKLVRCIRGAILDVAVDVRRQSPTFGQSVAVELTAAGGEQLYVPVGYAHGFLTLSDNVEVGYKTSDYYAPFAETGFRWDAGDWDFAWPLDGGSPTVSAKDAMLAMLADLEADFHYDGVPMTLVDARLGG
jgi:dTDP-4-dehydrorhamnose 3,5-epimerase